MSIRQDNWAQWSQHCRVATAVDPVGNSECCYTFHSPFTSDKGILVSLRTFVGTIEELGMKHAAVEEEEEEEKQPIFVRIVKQRVPKDNYSQSSNDNDNNKETSDAADPTKLAIGVEGGFLTDQDKYDIVSKHSVVVLERHNTATNPLAPPTVYLEEPYTDETKADFPLEIQKSVDSILSHVGVSLQQDVQVWQADDETIPVSKYAANLPFVDNGFVIDPHPSSWKCQKTGDTENLWLNLSDGFIGGGRKHWDGSGGSNGALDHYEETGRQYPLVVKLGTITSTDINMADCYSYAPDEDGPVKIPNLAELLEKRGIKVAHLAKTVKSTAELEVELNANYTFDAITEAGAELTPLSGPGLQGLQNLGNSCYMNAVLQLLLSGTVPELAKRYGTTPNGSVIDHPFIQTVQPTQATQDLLCQTTKVANALTSGVYCRPVAGDKPDDKEDATDPKYRLAPRMFKHVIGKDHVDFCTGQQQDAAQFLQYLLERLDRAELAVAVPSAHPLCQQLLKKENDQPVAVASRLFSFRMSERLVCSADNKVKYKDGSPETIWSLRIPMDKAVVLEKDAIDDKSKDDMLPDQKRQKSEPVPTIDLNTCIDEWSREILIDDIRWPHLNNAKHAARQLTRFASFPRYLLLQLQRYQLGPDWSPIKLEVNVEMPQEINLEAYRMADPQANETLIPDDVEVAPVASSATPTLDEGAIGQLMDMGFSLNSCKRALTAVGGSNVEAAMTWVFEHNMDPDFNDPLPEPGTGLGAASSAAAVDEGVVQSLVESLGCFTSNQVRAALKETSGAADRAADWLFSHMDDLDGAIAALDIKNSDAAGGNSNGPTSASSPLEDGKGEYNMIGMISHVGKNTGSGHYVAHLKKDGKWVIFNDEKVALSSQPPFEHAYLYLYQRKDTIGSPNANY